MLQVGLCDNDCGCESAAPISTTHHGRIVGARGLRVKATPCVQRVAATHVHQHSILRQSGGTGVATLVAKRQDVLLHRLAKHARGWLRKRMAPQVTRPPLRADAQVHGRCALRRRAFQAVHGAPLIDLGPREVWSASLEVEDAILGSRNHRRKCVLAHRRWHREEAEVQLLGDPHRPLELVKVVAKAVVELNADGLGGAISLPSSLAVRKGHLLGAQRMSRRHQASSPGRPCPEVARHSPNHGQGLVQCRG
mmetsp:Transcript_46654/g.107805  ORF Transcript_46654/g.107805 Transcript_46654/m.107805 type:complete len:251 (+) Transcript_46654:493-1245(+)